MNRVADVIWSLITWGLLAVIIVAALAGFHLYNSVDEEIRSHVETLLAKQYPHLEVTVRSAKLLELEGFEIRGITLAMTRQNGDVRPIAVADEVMVRCNPKLDSLLNGQVEVREIIARRVAVRATRDRNGQWSLRQLAKLPTLGGSSLPVVRLENSTLEFVDDSQAPTRLFTLRDINANIAPVGTKTASSSSAMLKLTASLSGDHLHRTAINGVIVPATGQWSLTSQQVQLDLSPALRSALPADLTRHVGQLDGFSARTTFGVSIAGQPNQPIQFDIAGQVHDGRVDDPRLPYPVTDLTSNFRLTHQSATVENIKARFGEATVACQILQPAGYQSPILVQGSVQNLHVDPKLVARLPDEWQERWQKFQPIGRMNVNNIHFVIDGQEIQPSMDIECLDVALTWDRFKYPLVASRGWLKVRPKHMAFELLAQGRARSQIRMAGDVYNPGPGWSGWFESESPGPVPIDEALLAAGSEKMQRVTRPFAAAGGLSFKAKFERNADLQLTKRVVINLADCTTRHASFPYTLTNVSGRMEMKDDDWLFKDIRGHNGGTSMMCSGSFDKDNAGGMLSLDLVGNNVLLESELRDSVSPGSQKMWRQMQPRGTVDKVHAHFELAKKVGHKRMIVTLEKFKRADQKSTDALSLTPVAFPYRVEDVSGSVRLVDGQLTMNRIRGRHGNLTVAADGSVAVDASGRWLVDFRNLVIDQLRLDREFLDAAPPNLGKALGSLALKGPVSLTGNLQLSANPQVSPIVTTSWNLDADVENATIGRQEQLRNISGGVHLVGQAAGGKMRCLGNLQIDSLMHRDWQLTNVNGPIRVDENQILFGTLAGPGLGKQAARPLRAKLFGGTVMCDSQLRMDEAGTFQSRIELVNADFATMMRDGVKRSMPIKGKASAQLRLAGNSQGRQTWSGNGAMQLRDSDMYDLPIILSLLKTARTGSTDRTAFDEADVNFRMQGENIYLDRIDLKGDALTLKGVGEISRNQQVDLKFYTMLGRESSYLASVRPLLGMASRRILMVKVEGTLDSPRMSREVLPGLNETLQPLFPEAAQPSGVEAIAVEPPQNGGVQRAGFLQGIGR